MKDASSLSSSSPPSLPRRRLQFSIKSSSSSVCLSSSPDGAAVRISKSTICCTCACLVYSVASLATVFLNRKLLTDLFPYPLTLSWFQEVVGVLVYLTLSSVGTAAAAASAASTTADSPSSDEEQEEEDAPGRPSSSSFLASLAILRKRRLEEKERMQRQPSSLLRRTLTASLRSPAACSLSTFFPHVEFSVRTLRRVLPLSMAFVGMIGFSNTCLKHVQVSTYQVARALTLLFNMVLQRLLLDIRISVGAGVSCGIVCLGFVVGALDESTLSLSGALTGAIASLFQAVYTVHIRSTLDALGGVQAAAMFYNMVNASLLFPPIIWFSGELHQLCSSSSFLFSSSSSSSHGLVNLSKDAEQMEALGAFDSASHLVHGMPEVASSIASSSSSLGQAGGEGGAPGGGGSSALIGSVGSIFSYASSLVFWTIEQAARGGGGPEQGQEGHQSFFFILFLAFLSGVAALLLTLSSFWIVGLTSPLTFNVLGYVKACLQTSLGFLVFREKCSPQALSGVVLTLSGSAAFSAYKRRDACREEEKKEPRGADDNAVDDHLLKKDLSDNQNSPKKRQ